MMTSSVCCRVCGTAPGAPSFRAAAPALTSITTALDSETIVHVCPACSHAQCPNLPDIEAFYDTEYRISLEDEHDQLVSIGADGTLLYRTDHQAAVSLAMLDLAPGALILDYGAAKSDTLRKMVGQRPDLVPHVFDVSRAYAFAWDGWIRPEHQATYAIDPSWRGRFDAVMSHFAIEHVADPLAFLADVRAVVKPGGKLLLSLPDVQANPGDMIVIDHLNHFTIPSLRFALERSGFAVDAVNTQDFPGAFFVTATARDGHDASPGDDVAEAVAHNEAICRFWDKAHAQVAHARDRLAGQPCAIYGAGFYGSWIAQQLDGAVKIVAVLDQNPTLQGSTRHGAPVIAPKALDPAIRTVFVGLNPLKARAIIDAVPSLADRELIWLD